MSKAQPSPQKQRKAVVPPKKVTKSMSVFDYLQKCQPPLDRKIIDIACSQTQIPAELRNDAGQEISLMWSQMTPDTKKYKPGQIAAYAHQMARHAALRLRRELGSSVRLPGSAFRKRKDGSSYVTPGVLAAALDWNELESWFQTDDRTDAPLATDGSGNENALVARSADEDMISEEDAEAALKVTRVEMLSKAALTDRQRDIVTRLVEGASYEDVMLEHNIKKGVLMRELAIAGSMVGPMEF